MYLPPPPPSSTHSETSKSSIWDESERKICKVQTSYRDLQPIVKILKFGTPKNYCNYPKIRTILFYYRVIGPKDADQMANSVDPDLSPLGAVLSESTVTLHCLPRPVCPKT